MTTRCNVVMRLGVPDARSAPAPLAPLINIKQFQLFRYASQEGGRP